ncbi:NAD-dependent epimerase/dehydratase family protein [Martelella limonii]|uniref:NAD-dependent epimerase/dehydratase family protein n=1 Tax=Martelella limonii TaxID=1647649 RepID=UPI00158067FD|nr:NAD(P)-dependent oxidoreductase [Martelella limonii]
MSRVLVSGGTGLVGRYIVEECLSAGHAVTVAGRTPPEPELYAAPVGFRPLTLGAPVPDRLFSGIDVFVHAAFSHAPGRYRGGEGDDPDGFLARNVAGSIALFEGAEAAGVRHAFFLSSRAVFDGYPAGTVLSETVPPNPKSLYGRAKHQVEQALAALARPGFIPVNLRATGVYGDLSPNKWEPLFERYARGETIEERAGSEVHGRDLARAILTLLDAPIPKISGKAFHLSDIVTDTHTILAPLKAAMALQHPLPPRADQAAVNAMTTTSLNALGWRTGGMPLLSATLQTLVSRFIANFDRP